MKPFLKWVGGKTQIIDKILESFPKTMHNYHEPFLGGGSVLLAILSAKQAKQIQITGTIYASDLNPNLIYLYKAVQSNLPELIQEVKQLITQYNQYKGTAVNRKPASLEDVTSTESYYYWIRNSFNILEDKSTIKASAMMFFLNKTCFRGVYREGPNGYNVPYGHYKNPSIMDETHMQDVSKLIQGVVFTCQPFMTSFEKIVKDDFIYLDPPYVPETATSFVGYTADGFNLEDHNKLFKECKKYSFVMSNSNVQLVRDAFPIPYKTTVVLCRRAINSKKPESKTNEIIIRS